MISLDVGCGGDRSCNVRVDIVRKVKPTIICDAQYLPLKSEIFDFVNCSHLLEHVTNPNRVLQEIKRVAKKDAAIVFKFPKPAFANNAKFYLYFLMFSFFPFSLQVVITVLKDCREILRRDVGRVHRWVITPKLIEKYFKVNQIEEYLSVCKMLVILNKRFGVRHVPQLYAAYIVFCSNNE